MHALIWTLAACQQATVDEEPTPEEAATAQVSAVESTLDDLYQTLLTVSWEQGAEATVWVEYQVDEGEWLTSPPRTVSPGPVSQLLLGLPYEHSVTFRVANDFGDGPLYSEEHDDNTHLYPDNLPRPDLVEGDPSQWDSGASYVFLSMEGGQDDTFTFIIDRRGRTVWARQNTPYTVSLHPRVSADGTQLLIDENTYWAVFDGGKGSAILRMHIDGTLVEEIATPGLHHPFTELPDGSIAWSASEGNNERVYLRSPDGDVEALFSCGEFLRDNGFGGYCGSNTLWYDPQTDHFLYSLYSAETVVEFDRQTGDVVRHFGHIDNAWAFSPADTAFWWQHGAYFTDAGTLLVSSKDRDNGSETVIREYALNEAEQTLEEVWSFGEGEDIYGDVMGEAHRLPGGNTLHNYGSATRLREVTPSGEVIWDVNWPQETMGRSTPIADLYDLMPPSAGASR
jgi:hypothetical protein